MTGPPLVFVPLDCRHCGRRCLIQLGYTGTFEEVGCDDCHRRRAREALELAAIGDDVHVVGSSPMAKNKPHHPSPAPSPAPSTRHDSLPPAPPAEPPSPAESPPDAERLDIELVAAPPAPPEPEYFRVGTLCRFAMDGSLYTLAEGSIVSARTHDLALLRAQNVPLIPAPEGPPLSAEARTQPIPAAQSTQDAYVLDGKVRLDDGSLVDVYATTEEGRKLQGDQFGRGSVELGDELPPNPETGEYPEDDR